MDEKLVKEVIKMSLLKKINGFVYHGERIYVGDNLYAGQTYNNAEFVGNLKYIWEYTTKKEPTCWVVGIEMPDNNGKMHTVEYEISETDTYFIKAVRTLASVCNLTDADGDAPWYDISYTPPKTREDYIAERLEEIRKSLEV